MARQPLIQLQSNGPNFFWGGQTRLLAIRGVSAKGTVQLSTSTMVQNCGGVGSRDSPGGKDLYFFAERFLPLT
jgi:hypothetical protein